MDTSYDKVISYLTEEKGLSLKEAEEIMVLCVEQGMDPTEIFGRGLLDMLGFSKKKVEPKPRRATRIPDATGGKPTGSLRSGNLSFPGDRSGAYDAAKQKLSTPKVEVPKIKTPPQTGGLLGTRSVPTMTDLGAAPKPQFGPGSTNTGQSFPKPPRVARDAGAAVRQRFMARPPVAPAVRPNLLSKVRGGPASTVLNIATGAALDNYVVKPVAKAGGNALTRTILDITGKGDRARQVNPELYGKSGPNLTPEIVKGVQQRSKLAQQSAETQAASQPKPEPKGERSAAANAEKQEVAKANAQRRRAAAADFDKTFAAKRAAGEKEFTWRGKKYTTKLKGE
jgi:hypothetical protein